MKNHGHSDAAFRHIRRELQLHRALLLVTPVAFLACSALRTNQTTQPGLHGAVSFEEVTVERINVREPDGRLRLVLTNETRSPDPIVSGQEFENSRQGGNPPGLLFYNDEGDESGGLVYDGEKGSAGAGLLFDRYKQDQTVGLVYEEEAGKYLAGLNIWDRSATPMTEMYPQLERALAIEDESLRDAELEKLRREGLLGAQRAFLGRHGDGEAQLRLHDAAGKLRLKLSVDEDGEPKISFLDETGKVTFALPPQSGETGS